MITISGKDKRMMIVRVNQVGNLGLPTFFMSTMMIVLFEFGVGAYFVLELRLIVIYQKLASLQESVLEYLLHMYIRIGRH